MYEREGEGSQTFKSLLKENINFQHDKKDPTLGFKKNNKKLILPVYIFISFFL